MKLMDYLPDFYAGSPEVVNIQEAIEIQSAALRAARDDLMAQLNVQTATWGLNNWEKALDIVPKTGDSFDNRRQKVSSKLRGAGTTTFEMMKSVAESFSSSEVDITVNPSEYHFSVIFIGDPDAPLNINALSEAIEDIKPAHLDYDVQILFSTTSTLYSALLITDYRKEDLT